MWSAGVGDGLLFAVYIVELIVVVVGVRWAIRTHRRIGELQQDVAYLKGRGGAPGTPLGATIAGEMVYSIGERATTPQRPARRP